MMATAMAIGNIGIGNNSTLVTFSNDPSEIARIKKSAFSSSVP